MANSIINADSDGLKSTAGDSQNLVIQTGANAAITIGSTQDVTLNSTGYLGIPVGTTAQRPGSPVAGMLRLNTTTGFLEVYYAGTWVNAVALANPTTVELLVVAGGGTGGVISNIRGAGGGAGGLIYITNFPIDVGTYTATIGGGGSSSSGTAAANGSNTVFSGNARTLTAIGGGSGGYNDNTNNGGTGGSGGGQWYTGYAGAASTQPANTSDGISTYTGTGFGNAGGSSGSAQPYGGGGGGAGAAGGNWNAGGGPVGGVGKQYSISGISAYYAGGGGAAGYPLQAGYVEYAGGLGGGGTGSNDSYDAISNATANTGGGGGSGGSGGSGIVIIRHSSNYVTGTVTGGGVITTSGGYTIYTFPSSGTVTW